MNATQLIIWTAVPHLSPEGAPRISVVVTPRLKPESGASATLADFPDFVDWPAREVGFNVQLADLNQVVTHSIGVAPATYGQSELWRSVFHLDDPVRPFRPPFFLDGHRFASYGLAPLHAFVRDSYQHMAMHHATTRPSVATLGSETSPLGTLLSNYAHKPAPDLATFNDDMWPRGMPQLSSPSLGVIPGQPGYVTTLGESFLAAQQRGLPSGTIPAETVKAMAGLRACYTTAAVLSHAPPRPTPPVLDFHAVITTMARHRPVAVALGLIIEIDLELDLDILKNQPLIRVVPYWTTNHLPGFENHQGAPVVSRHVSPWTKIASGASFFTPAPSSTDNVHGNGMLNLHDTDIFEGVTVDVEGATLQALDLAEARGLGVGAGGANADAAIALPALRGPGISVAQTGRVDTLVRHHQTMRNYQSGLTGLGGGVPGHEIVFSAEDLTRGIRIDIWDDHTKVWHSLCQQVATYSLPTETRGLSAIHEEGYVAAAVTAAPNSVDGSNPTVNLPESLFLWDGWSLTAARPGKAVVNSGEQPTYLGDRHLAPHDVTPVTPEADTGLRVDVQVAAGSLPRLRYGWRYRVRARTVDVAGSSLTVDQANALTGDAYTLAAAGPVPYCTEQVTFGRLEPVRAPVVVPVNNMGPGETIDRMVTLTSADPQGDTPTVARHIAPPQATELTIERHGVFDQMNPAQLESAYAQRLGEVALWNSPGVAQTFVEDFPKHPITKAQILNAQMHGEQTLNLTYPADPAATEAVFVIRPGQAGWPLLNLPDEHGPFVYAVPFQNQVTLGQRGHIAAVSDPSAAGTGLAETPAPAHTGPVIVDTQASGSIHPTAVNLTTGPPTAEEPWPHSRPFRLEVVPVDHSEPLKFDGSALTHDRIMRIELPQASRLDIELACGLEGSLGGVPIVDQMGIWALAGPGDQRARTEASHGLWWMMTPGRPLTLIHAVPSPLRPPELEDSFHASRTTALQTEAELTGKVLVDAKSTVRIDIEAAWNDYTDDGVTVRPDLPKERTGHVATIAVPFNASIDSREPVDVDVTVGSPTGSVAGSDLALIHHFPDTRHRQVTYTAVAASRFGDYFDPADLTPAVSAGSLQTIMSTARPTSPHVRDVIPTFAWDTVAAGEMIVKTRHASRVRVYLERPWFSSGEGELLGVTFAPEPGSKSLEPGFNSDDVRSKFGDFATVWGSDPARASDQEDGTSSDGPFANAKCFPAAVNVQTVHLEEILSPVGVAGHKVHWDTDLECWYADIELDLADHRTNPDRPLTIFPFVRLAVVRYQPNSLPGLEVSHVVLADWIQTLPDRTATVAVDQAAKSVTVGLTGRHLRPAEAHLEVFDPSLAILSPPDQRADNDLAWVRVPVGSSPQLLSTPDGDALQATLPIPGNPDGHRVRLVLLEWDDLPADDLPADDAPSLAPKRLIYADAIELRLPQANDVPQDVTTLERSAIEAATGVTAIMRFNAATRRPHLDQPL